MPEALLTVDPHFTIGAVNRRLFGAFVEHLGRCVYTGIYEPGHPLADEDGFRTDVLELARELGAREVDVVGDSELVARQVGGEYMDVGCAEIGGAEVRQHD